LGAGYTWSVAVVAVRGIAVTIITRIEATIPAVKAATIPAVKAATIPAVKTAAAKPSTVETTTKPAAVETAQTSTKAADLCSTSADRGGECDSYNGSSDQQLVGHWTLLFDIPHPIFVTGALNVCSHLTGLPCQKQIGGLTEYGSAFAGLELDKTRPLLLSLYMFSAFQMYAGVRHDYSLAYATTVRPE
jgi:hypothetical protein